MEAAELEELIERLDEIYRGASCLVGRMESLSRTGSASEPQDTSEIAELAAITAKLIEFTQQLSVQTAKMIEASRQNMAAARKMSEAAGIYDAASKRMLEAGRLMNTASVRQGTRRS